MLKRLLEGPLVVLQSEGVQGARHSLLHFLHVLKSAPPELVIQLWEHPEVAGGQFWTVQRVRDRLDGDVIQIVSQWDRLVAWCIVLVQVPLARLEDLWPLATKSFPELLRLNLFLNSFKTSTSYSLLTLRL